ncbi:hypothetical protein [Rhodoferax fermentans]|nr:hypothetical protein [Rhodoferax fermentans]
MATDTVLPPARKMLVLESAWEIENLIGLLLDKASSDEWDLEHEQAMILRGLGTRIQDLSRVVMSAMSDEVATIEELQIKVFGTRFKPSSVAMAPQ